MPSSRYNAGSAPGPNNLIGTDPGFVIASAGAFHLTSGSLARDAGVSLPDVPCDIDGDSRPAGSVYDIGAYEYGGTPAQTCPKGGGGGGATPIPPPTQTPPPVITLTATPSTLPYVGQGTQIFWRVQNATSCTASGGWSGAKAPTRGNGRYYPTQSTVYILSCIGPGGTSQKAVTVTIGTSGACTKYQQGSTIPQGFGVPWDVTNPSSLLLRATCPPPSVTLDIGDNSNLTYIYKTAYVAPNSATSWTPLDLFGSGLISDAWFPGSAQGIVTIPDTGTASFWVAYTCHWTGSKWTCGCRDSACTQSYWQI
jgi:hypothetical protein